MKTFPHNIPDIFVQLGAKIEEVSTIPSTLAGSLAITLQEPGFYQVFVLLTLQPEVPSLLL